MAVNSVCITGNLTRTPELRFTAGGTAVLPFCVAVNDRRKNQQTGEWEDVPNFVDCTMFGARAESLSRFLTKGSKVAIDGRLRYGSWEQDGKMRSALRVTVDEIDLMSRKADEGREGQASDGAAAPAPSPDAGGEGVYEDIPF